MLPNFTSSVPTIIKSDVFGVRVDHQLTANDTLFGRFNRENSNLSAPATFNTLPKEIQNFIQTAALGYTHTFDPKTILNFRYGFAWKNNFVNTGVSNPGWYKPWA